MAETLLSSGVQKLCDLLVQESDRLKGVDEQLTELRSDLNLLRSFLKDAETKKHASEMVRKSVEEINEIVLDAEDVIETFVLKEELSKANGIKKRMRILSCIAVDRKEVASEMGGISKRISKVIHDMQSFGVQQMIVVDRSDYSETLQQRQREIRHTLPSSIENGPVELGDNVKKLVGFLVEEESIQVVSICGMGGIGKTTLARQVFNHERIKSHFPGLVWVCVSQQYTRKSVWQMILRQLRPEFKVFKMTENELQEKLVRVLETQKALIVLDDIWRIEDWDILTPIFPREIGGKVLVTSRNEGVALHVGPKCITFKPEFLALEESWNLFQRIAFPRKDKTDYNVDEEMEALGKQMIKYCGGLTLAVKLLGGLLAAQRTLHEWKGICEKIQSHIDGGTSFDDNHTSPLFYILSLCFEELPYYLKHCFLYLAHFPEDYAIDVEKLTYYLAAEGIPRPIYYESASVRDVVDGYIEELVERNMVMSERDGTTLRFEKCHLHDIMREICLCKAKEENFLHTVNSTETSLSRRLVIQSHDDIGHMERVQSPKIRSLLLLKQSPLLNWMTPDLLFTRLQLMRVLDLSQAKFEGGKVPSSIGKLIHLRYLSLLGAYVTHLPSSIQNLKLLIYLNLCVAPRSPIYMSNFVKELRELRYLSLPWEIQDKTKLELAKLSNLETLENFSSKRSNWSDLHGMIRLTTLSILLNGEGCSMETLSSSLSEMQHLENLSIRDHGADKTTNILDFIHLKLKQQLVQVVQPLPFHLTTISLRHCYLKEDPMPVLEKLLHLKEVYLGGRSFSGKRIVCSRGGFPQLQKLILNKLVQLEEWIVEEGSMPLLQTLSIRFCDKLKELSDGLRFIPMRELTVVIIERGFIEKLSKGGEDYYKVEHIPVLKIYGYLKN